MALPNFFLYGYECIIIFFCNYFVSGIPSVNWNVKGHDVMKLKIHLVKKLKNHEGSLRVTRGS